MDYILSDELSQVNHQQPPSWFSRREALGSSIPFVLCGRLLMRRKEAGIGLVSLVLAFGKMAASELDSSFEFEVQNENDKEETENKTDESSLPSADEIFNQIKESFGEVVAKSFRDQDATQLIVIQDLLTRDAESGIFEKLQLSFGQAVRFKKEFSHLLPSVANTCRCSTPKPCNGKPTMGQLSSFTPAVRRLYLTKRKQVGTLASEHWNYKFPKFNTPERKAELAKFSSTIAKECAVPSAGFNTDGIMKHIQDFFNEQRRYKKRKQDATSPSCSESAGSSSEVELSPPLSQLPSMPKENQAKAVKEDIFSPKNCEDGDDNSESSHDTVILSDSLSGNEPDEALEELSSPKPASEDKITRKSAMVIIKAVIGKIPDREELVKLLRGKFQVKSKNLTTLTASQIMEVTARKLIALKYISVKFGVNNGDIKNADIKVHKEIDL